MRCFPTLGYIAVAVLACAAMNGAKGASTYTIVDLGLGTARDINSSGQVVGDGRHRHANAGDVPASPRSSDAARRWRSAGAASNATSASSETTITVRARDVRTATREGREARESRRAHPNEERRGVSVVVTAEFTVEHSL